MVISGSIGEHGINKDLLTMSKFLIIAMASAAALFIGLSAMMNALFLSSLGRTSLEASILAALSVTADITKAALPVIIMRAASVRAWVHAAGASVLLLLVTVLSLSSGTGFAALTRGGAVAARQAHVDQRAALEAALQDTQRRIALVANTRPLSVIEADIAVAMTDRRWSMTKSCSEITGPSARQFCADILKLRSEGAASLEHARLADERNAARSKLALHNSESSAEADPQAAAIAVLLGVDTATPRRVLVTFLAIVIELGAAILVLAGCGACFAALARARKRTRPLSGSG